MGRFLSEPEYLNHTLVLGMISDYDGDAYDLTDHWPVYRKLCA